MHRESDELTHTLPQLAGRAAKKAAGWAQRADVAAGGTVNVECWEILEARVRWLKAH